MLKFSIVLEEVAKFDAARMDYAPQTQAEMEAFARMLQEACEDLTEQDFRTACKAYRKANRKWPSPAAVVECAPSTAQAKIEEADRRIDWWPAVLPTRSTAGSGATEARLLHCFRSYARSRLGIEADDEDFRRVSRAVEAVGGWDALGHLSEQEATYARSRFIKALEGRQEPDTVIRLEEERRKRIPGSPAWIRIGGGK